MVNAGVVNAGARGVRGRDLRDFPPVSGRISRFQNPVNYVRNARINPAGPRPPAKYRRNINALHAAPAVKILEKRILYNCNS